MSDCLFCKIVAGEIPSKLAHQDDELIAFHDINPQAPVHILIVPRKHIASLDDATEDDRELMGRVLLVARRLADDHGIAYASTIAMRESHATPGERKTASSIARSLHRRQMKQE